MKATITEVAQRAGVSIKTVSRVINREPNVREATRAKVLAAAEALDYQPNPSARGLAGSRSFSIGMLYSNPVEFGYVKDNLFGAFTACREMGYSLLLHPCNERPDLEDLRRFFQLTNIDGLILAAPVCDDPGLLKLLAEIGMPFAQIASLLTAPNACAVHCNDYDASYALTEYVINLGHRRIGFIKGDAQHASSKRRYEAYKACLKDHSLKAERTLIRQGKFDFDSGSRAAYQLLKLDDPPTAIIASNDDMAAGVLFAAHESGVKVPAQLSVTGFDDTPAARQSWPQLTTAHQPIVDMSFAAAAMLISGLGGTSGGTLEQTFECDLIIRGSTGPAPSER